MTAPTRRQITRRHALATGAAGAAVLLAGAAPVDALEVDPRTRVERAIAALQAAFEAYYPRAHVEVTFNGTTPEDMYFKPQPGGWSYAPDCAAVLVFASVDPFEHGRWWRDFDFKAHERWIDGVYLRREAS